MAKAHRSPVNYSLNFGFLIHKNFIKHPYFNILVSSYGPDDNVSWPEYIVKGHPLSYSSIDFWLYFAFHLPVLSNRKL